VDEARAKKKGSALNLRRTLDGFKKIKASTARSTASVSLSTSGRSSGRSRARARSSAHALALALGSIAIR